MDWIEWVYVHLVAKYIVLSLRPNRDMRDGFSFQSRHQDRSQFAIRRKQIWFEREQRAFIAHCGESASMEYHFIKSRYLAYLHFVVGCTFDAAKLNRSIFLRPLRKSTYVPHWKIVNAVLLVSQIPIYLILCTAQCTHTYLFCEYVRSKMQFFHRAQGGESKLIPIQLIHNTRPHNEWRTGDSNRKWCIQKHIFVVRVKRDEIAI